MRFDFVRRQCNRLLAGPSRLRLTDQVPSRAALHHKLHEVRELGLYLHIPFCRQICPYCPYNKEIYAPDLARQYARAVKREIDFYADLINPQPITSFYIGGGTPTTMLNHGLEDILEHLFRTFDMQCEIHMESHPNDLSSRNLDQLRDLGVRHLSTGIEALQDRHLKFLRRPYTAAQAKETIVRTAGKGFHCFNVDMIFALPGQTEQEIDQTSQALADWGVDQVAAYPLFRFPYTPFGQTPINNENAGVYRRRKMLRLIEQNLYAAGFERTSVWAFTRQGIPRYCSVTVPLYVGLGASGGSYLRDVFYLNTFNVREYIKALMADKMPIALAIDLTEKMQLAGWLYWRIYETRLSKERFQLRFGREWNTAMNRLIKILAGLGWLKEDPAQVVLTDQGAYWLHAFEDLFSIDYIGKLWSSSITDPWPKQVLL